MRLAKQFAHFKVVYGTLRDRMKLTLILKIQYMYRRTKRRERRAVEKAIVEENERILRLEEDERQRIRRAQQLERER